MKKITFNSIKNTIIKNIKEINIKKFLILTGILVGTLLIDLLTKYYICKETITRSINDPIVVISKILSFTYSENTGASWGLFGEHTSLLSFFTISLTLGLIIFLLLSRKTHFLMQLSLALIISGGLGNIYDRLKFGYVRDFIDYTFIKTIFNYDFPICNFADLVLVVGCVMMMVFIIFFYNKHYNKMHPEKINNDENSALKSNDNFVAKIENAEQINNNSEIINIKTENENKDNIKELIQNDVQESNSKNIIDVEENLKK